MSNEFTQLTQEKKGGGNTNSSREKRYRNWMVTINTPSEDDVTRFTQFTQYVYQFEEGENKTRHLQGYIQLKDNKTLMQMKKLLPRAHLEPRKGTAAQAIAYCSKENTRIAGPWSKSLKIEKPLKIISNLRPWQKEIEDIILKEPDDRTVHWYWEKKGGCGKTALCKYLVVKYGALYLSGKSADVKYAVAQACQKEKPEIILWDIPRSNLEYVSYESIEKIKDGIFFSGKYESETVIMNPPHVIIFANEKPEILKLSQDRWKIKQIE